MSDYFRLRSIGSKPGIVNIPVQKNEPTVAPKKEEPVIKSKKYSNIFIIRILAGIVAILAAGISWYYTFLRFISFNSPIPSAITALVVMSCALLLPEFSILFFIKQKWQLRILGIIILIIGLFAILTSMTNTVQGIYDVYTKSQKIDDKYEINMQLQKQANDNLAIYKTELERINATLDDLASRKAKTETESRLYSDLAWRESVANKSKATILTKIAELSNKIDTTTQAKKRSDAYAWLASIIGADAENIEFIILIFMAALLDIVAPILLGLALFVKED